MDRVVLIGDELVATAFVLAGVQAWAATPADAGARFDAALASASLVVLTPGVVAALDPAAVRAAVLRGAPPVVVMPDLAAPQADAGVARRLRATLGIEG